MRILIIGGGVFLGRAPLDAALGRGHRVGVFNRGRARQDGQRRAGRHFYATQNRNDKRNAESASPPLIT